MSWRLDPLGVATSSVCAVHCVLGAMVSGSGLAGALVRDERLESGLLLAAVSIAVTATVVGYRRHRDRWVVLLIAAGLFGLGAGRLLEPGHLPEPLVSVIAAALCVGAHVRNARLLHRRCASCRADAT